MYGAPQADLREGLPYVHLAADLRRSLLAHVNRARLQLRSLAVAKGSPAEIRNRLGAYTKGQAQLADKMGELIKRYPNQWIAVRDNTIVCRARSLTSLKKRSDKDGIELRDAIIRHLVVEEQIMVL